MDNLSLELLQQAEKPHYSRMAIAVLLSVTAHALLLLTNFVPIQISQPISNIAVTLVNSQSPHPPIEAQALAQFDLDGGGQHQGIASSPLPYTTDIDTPASVLEALQKRQAELEQQQLRLLSLLDGKDTVPAENAQPDFSGDSGINGQDNIDQQSQILNAQIAAIKEKIRAYNANPKRTFVAPSTKAVNYAQYVENWRSKIEAIGTKHYPAQARGKIYGDLQLTVYIRKDGQLDHIEFDRPATAAILNSAAKRIIELSQPFEPLPKELAQDTDILAITRTWHFTHDGLATN